MANGNCCPAFPLKVSFPAAAFQVDVTPATGVDSASISCPFTYPDDIWMYTASRVVSAVSGSVIEKEVVTLMGVPGQYICSPVAFTTGGLLVCANPEKAQQNIRVMYIFIDLNVEFYIS